MADEKKSRGRAPFSPTDDQRARVRDLARSKTHEEIAADIGVSQPTLRRHFASELKPAGQEGPSLLDCQLPPPKLSRKAATPEEAKPAGRPEHEPNYETRRTVELLVAAGTPMPQIAHTLGISEPTLRKHYPEQIGQGRAKVFASMLASLHAAARKGNVAAIGRMIDIIQHAEMEDISARLRGKAQGQKPDKAEPLGKKAQAAQDALDAASKGSWASLLKNAGPTGELPQ